MTVDIESGAAHESRVGGSEPGHVRSILSAWIALVGLTVVSWWLGFAHGSDSTWVIAALMVLAFAKVYLVGHSFMEVRSAPPVMRKLFAYWCVGSSLTIIAAAFLWS